LRARSPSVSSSSPKPGGYVGMINANSFSEAGSSARPLLKKVVPRVKLTGERQLGAYFPATARRQSLLFAATVLPSRPRSMSVMGKRGNPRLPKIPSGGTSGPIAQHQNTRGWIEYDYISFAEIPRETCAGSRGAGAGRGRTQELPGRACEKPA
jgi:hypothetical protein